MVATQLALLLFALLLPEDNGSLDADLGEVLPYSWLTRRRMSRRTSRRATPPSYELACMAFGNGGVAATALAHWSIASIVSIA